MRKTLFLCFSCLLLLFALPAASAGAANSTVTLTFRVGGQPDQTVTVVRGEYPTDIPDIPSLPGARVLGWFNEQGVQLYPGNYPARTDAVYTARWSRTVSDLLKTDDHTGYIQGYQGMFMPNRNVTRAEAAQMFYSLLRSTNWPKAHFTDVKDQWFAEAVETMGGLGVVRGTTDGSFQPNREITRAEFVTMAVACDTILSDERSGFPDVSPTSWAAPYIATAASKGWISGYSDGKFHPNDKLNRAQAVTILNSMLGRSPDPDVKGKRFANGFMDVFPENWAYGQILEASTDHIYSRIGDGEVWVNFTPAAKGGWVFDGDSKYYVDEKTGQALKGKHTIGGVTYFFDEKTGEAFSGFRMLDGWRRYYKNGQLMEDISELGVVSGPYLIKVYKNSNYLIIYAKDSSGAYNTPVRAVRTSCGYGTITGTYYTPAKYRWQQMFGGTYAQWVTQVNGNYLMHSVPNWTYSNNDLEVEEYNHLGEFRSMGCIRMNCRDAKWIYDNCALGTQVTITVSEDSGPLAKPAGLAPLPSWHTWDPTDPEANWRCREHGCH